MQIVPDYIPQAFGAVLLSLSLILTLAPYFAGHDFGIFKIPSFREPTNRRLKFGGPIALALAIVLHLPIPTGPRMCEEPVYEIVSDAELCGTTTEEYTVTPARPKTCQHPDFGRVGWNETKPTTQSSGWVGGGSNPTNWCNKVLDNFLQARNITKYDHKILSSSEKDRKDLAGHVEYNYTCSIEISWDPIYAEKTDARCGMIPAVKETREVPNQCRKQIGTRKVPCQTDSTT
jgi:hypothetical protein